MKIALEHSSKDYCNIISNFVEHVVENKSLKKAFGITEVVLVEKPVEGFHYIIKIFNREAIQLQEIPGARLDLLTDYLKSTKEKKVK